MTEFKVGDRVRHACGVGRLTALRGNGFKMLFDIGAGLGTAPLLVVRENLLERLDEPVFGGTLKIGPVYDATHYGLDETFCENVADVFEAQRNVLLKKHHDYGSLNIAGAPGGPLNGLRVRMWDKLARINHLVDSGVEPENESLVDSFADLANYALIALLVLRGEWPGCE